MKRVAALALLVMALVAASAFTGCGQAEGPGGNPGQGASGGACVSFIDVGKGDCILVQVGESAALIDAGYDDTSDDVVSYLRKRGVDHLDFLIVTHYDKDHVGGVRAIGEALDIDTVYLPGYEGADKHYRGLMAAIGDLGLASERVTREMSLTLGGASVQVFPSGVAYVADTGDGEGNDNDMSLVTTLTSGEDTYLFAGDLEEEGIEAYLEGNHGRFYVLKVPHHGRKSSNTDELLVEAFPRIAVITDSADSPADKKTLKQLEKAGVDTYRTSVSGTIVVKSNGEGGYEISPERG